MTPEERQRIEKEYIATRIKLSDRLVAAGWVSKAVYVEGERGDFIFTEKGKDKMTGIIRPLVELGYDPESVTREDVRAFYEIVYGVLHSMPPREGRPLE